MLKTLQVTFTNAEIKEFKTLGLDPRKQRDTYFAATLISCRQKSKSLAFRTRMFFASTKM